MAPEPCRSTICEAQAPEPPFSTTGARAAPPADFWKASQHASAVYSVPGLWPIGGAFPSNRPRRRGHRGWFHDLHSCHIAIVAGGPPQDEVALSRDPLQQANQVISAKAGVSRGMGSLRGSRCPKATW